MSLMARSISKAPDGSIFRLLFFPALMSLIDHDSELKGSLAKTAYIVGMPTVQIWSPKGASERSDTEI